MNKALASIGLLGALGACAGSVAQPAMETASRTLETQLRDVNGRTLANARISAEPAGLRIAVESAGLQAGTYAVHVHAVGRCEAPGFTSAGPHWNPAGRQHGFENPQGSHSGDLPNLVVGATGQGSFEYLIRGAAMDGAAGLLDADGAAVVVHAQADDFRTDPAGNAGGRIGCGVLS